jgi:hypothetical protein
VQTICARLEAMSTGRSDDETGGSTYTFVIWPGHPHEDEVAGELARYRARQTALRAKVDDYNRQHGIPPTYREVTTYAGQHSMSRERRDREDDHDTF